MEEETRYTKQDLETMRAWTLQRKIQVTQTRLIEWLGRYDWNVYVSFSGGKDSTVLADLAARVYQVFSCPKRQDPLRLVFVNTGLEYPEIQKFVRDFAEWLKAKYKIPVELEILHPSMTFPQVLSKYGYPVISKETAKVIYYARRGSRWAINRLDGLDKHGNESKFKERFKNSPSSLASRPIRILLADEIDRYPATAGNEGDPLLLAGKRLATFWNKKEVCVSTPTNKETSRIAVEFEHSTQEEWNVPCPACGAFTPLGLDVWDYSNQPGNVLGQICPAFGLLWFFIMPLAIWAEDTTRYLVWAYDCAVYHSQEAPPTIAPYSLKSVYGDFICGR